MKSWLISITVISVLSVIADMLLPKSQVSKYARLCISLLLTATMVMPIISVFNKDVSIDLPVYETMPEVEQSNLIDEEFSSRITSSLRSDTGFDNVRVKAKLGYDRVTDVHISDAENWQKEKLESVLADKYNIPVEIVTYGAD